MTLEEIRQALPEQPRPELTKWIKRDFLNSELGGEYTIFRRDSVYVESEPDFFPYNGYGSGAYHNAALCLCTACGNEYVLGWDPRQGYKHYGVRMYVGEDGQTYDGYVSYDEDDQNIVSFHEGESINCPYCSECTKLIHKKSINPTRTFGLLAMSVEKVGNVCAVMTWLYERTLYQSGKIEMNVYPCEAVVLKNSKLYLFSHVLFRYKKITPDKEWRQLKRYSDENICARLYYSYEAVCHTKTGGAVFCDVPDLTGTSAEKTGLREYVTGCEYDVFPLDYLKYWKSQHNIENLIKSTWRTIIDSEIEEARENSYSRDLKLPEIISNVIYFNEVKPHKMLGLTKEDFRTPFNWSYRELFEFQQYNDYIGSMSVAEFQFYLNEMDFNSVSMCNEYTLDGYEHFDIREIHKYCLKQFQVVELGPSEVVSLLIDYREALYRQNGNRLTYEQFFPRNLIEAHDRLLAEITAKENEKSKQKFKAVAKKYRYLEYSDGELCAILPQTPEDLVKEGNTLRHCVGGYADKFASESDVIFFIRHSRRPERSYYTLDISFTGKQPKQIQLHGYGNERHGANKQYKHSIPQKVLDFVSKYVNNILLPRWNAAQAEKKKGNRKNGKSDSTAA